MFKIIDDVPPDVVAIEAVGKVTHEDYRDTLIPRAKAMMGQGPIKMLYVIGSEFTSFEHEALWDDGLFGLRHSHDFSRIAVVGDQAWLRAAIGMFRPFFPCEVRLFGLSELAGAKAWVSSAKQTAPG